MYRIFLWYLKWNWKFQTDLLHEKTHFSSAVWKHISYKMRFKKLSRRYHDNQHNDIQHNDPQHNDPQHNDPQHNDPQHNDPQHNVTLQNNKKRDTQYINIQHNNTWYCYAVRLCRLLQISAFCWVSLCLMSLCWVSRRRREKDSFSTEQNDGWKDFTIGWFLSRQINIIFLNGEKIYL